MRGGIHGKGLTWIDRVRLSASSRYLGVESLATQLVVDRSQAHEEKP